MNFLDLTKAEQHRYFRLQNSYMTSDTQDIQCPYCHKDQGFDWEDVSYEDDGYASHNCYDCGKGFQVHTGVTYNFTTEIPDEEIYDQIEKERNNNSQ